jgi:hypothetical protein
MSIQKVDVDQAQAVQREEVDDHDDGAFAASAAVDDAYAEAGADAVPQLAAVDHKTWNLVGSRMDLVHAQDHASAVASPPAHVVVGQPVRALVPAHDHGKLEDLVDLAVAAALPCAAE